MARSRQVTIQFLGDAKGLISASNAAGRSTTTLGDKLKRVGKAAMIGFAGAAVVAAKAGYEFAEMAVEDEKSAALLANTLRNATGATKAQVSAVEEWISKQGELLGVTDDDLRPAISRLAVATGDIAKAEDLASLAMDVAVGKNKDLKTVSEALAKAQEGNIGALGRLGVKTKDAEGKTRALADITADLADKYAGSASKAADTAAGKFQRVKVALSETAEDLGYKLLPYVNEFGDWLVDDGVPGLERLATTTKREVGPALQDLAGWVGENKDEFFDLARQVGGALVPAMKTAGGVVGDAVSFFNKLPPPVREVAIEAGVAAIAFSKLNQALGTMQFQGFINNIGDAEKRTAALATAARTAAGVGGLTALMDGVHRSNDAVAGLEVTLGAAATGFAVGGPWGAAILGAGGLVYSLGKHFQNTGKDAEEAYQEIQRVNPTKQASAALEDLKSTLDQVTGAYTGATRAAVLHKLEEAGLIETAAKYGVSARSVVNAAMGQRKAMSSISPVINNYKNRLAEITEEQDRVNHATESYEQPAYTYGSQYARLTKAATEHLTALEKEKKGLQTSLSELEQMPGALAKMGSETRHAAAATADYSGKLKGIPSQVRTVIQQQGIEPTARAIADLTKRYNLTPKQVKTLIQATGADTTARQIQGIIDRADRLDGRHVDTYITTHYNTTYGGQAGGGGHSTGAGEKGGGKDGDPTTPQKLASVYGLDERRAKNLERQGMGLVISIARGLKKGERTLKNVLDGLQDYIQTKTDKLNEILSGRNSFVEGFRDAFSESIFSAQFTDADGNAVPPTLQKMMQFAEQQRNNARALSANVQSLLGKGLSRDLLAQLASQGQSGFDQIAALATGSQADIAAFNQMNAETRQTLEALGTDLYNALNPDKVEQAKQLQAQIDSALRQEGHLKRIADAAEKGEEIHIKGTDLVILLHRQERADGKKYLAS